MASLPRKIAALETARRVSGVRGVIDDLHVQLPASLERTDDEIGRAVRHSLEWDVTVPDDRIMAEVASGVVTLNGCVSTLAQRMDAERAVERVTGLRGLVNSIEVEPVRVHAEKLKLAIESALERQEEFYARSFEVSAVEGVVVLVGSARSWQQKRSAERVIAQAPGVRRVDDRTTVDPGE